MSIQASRRRLVSFFFAGLAFGFSAWGFNETSVTLGVYATIFAALAFYLGREADRIEEMGTISRFHLVGRLAAEMRLRADQDIPPISRAEVDAWAIQLENILIAEQVAKLEE